MHQATSKINCNKHGKSCPYFILQFFNFKILSKACFLGSWLELPEFFVCFENFRLIQDVRIINLIEVKEDLSLLRSETLYIILKDLGSLFFVLSLQCFIDFLVERFLKNAIFCCFGWSLEIFLILDVILFSQFLLLKFSSNLFQQVFLALLYKKHKQKEYWDKIF